eukprot:3769390-Prymnesium_polylepis.1
MTLAQFFSQIPVLDARVKQTALAELGTALQKCRLAPDGTSARVAVATIMLNCSDRAPLSYDEAVARYRSLRPGGEDWDCFIARRTVAMVLFPLAALKVQTAFRRRLRERRAVLVIQKVVLEWLHKPGGWGFHSGLREALSVLER